MSANTQALDSGAASGMNLEIWCVLAMGALFGLFLLGVWLELRSSLRSISDQAQQHERAVARLEAEAALARQVMREAASARLASLRAAEARAKLASTQVLAAAADRDGVVPAMGFESVGRILERLAQAAPHSAARPPLSMVSGGQDSDAADEAGEGAGNAPGRAAARRSRGAAVVPGTRGKARDGVKSSSIGSGAIGSGAMFASR